jgi:sulfite reductase (ferredoxin)
LPATSESDEESYPAEAVEALKGTKNPWEALDEIRGFAKAGWDSIPYEWLRTYFTWWGVYTQATAKASWEDEEAKDGPRLDSWFVFESRAACCRPHKPA